MARIAEKTQAQFEAEHDARTMMEAEAVTSDKARLGKARVAARRLLKEEKARLKGLEKVAKVPPKKKNNPSHTRKRSRR